MRKAYTNDFNDMYRSNVEGRRSLGSVDINVMPEMINESIRIQIQGLPGFLSGGSYKKSNNKDPSYSINILVMMF
jgi:hypothetical protein